MARLQAKIQERAEQIVGAVAGAGDIDFVEAVSARLPTLTVADMIEEFIRHASRSSTSPAQVRPVSTPTQHIGFGGGGVHFCLGNGVAKAQLRALFGQILTKLPGLQVTGESKMMRSDFINGIVQLRTDTR